MRPRFDDSYIRTELERIGEHLDEPLTVFLIGGGAMAFYGLKDTTKDIDLVVASGENLGQFRATLLEQPSSSKGTRSSGNPARSTTNSAPSGSSRTTTVAGSTSSISR